MVDESISLSRSDDETNQSPLFSVFMANYNHGHFIETALTALTSQSLPPDEIVVVDDGSTDDSVDIITRLSTQYASVRLVRNETNQGAIAASQRAFDATRGKYVYAASADDWVLPGFVEQTVDMLENHPSAGLCFTLRQETDTDGNVVLRDRPTKPSDTPTYFSPADARRILLNDGFFIAGTNTVYRRSNLTHYLPWEPDLGAFIDGFVAHTIALDSGACFIPENLMNRRGGGERYSLQDSNDPDLVFTRANKAALLMADTYSHIWPPGFAQQYQNMAARDLVTTLLGQEKIETAEYRSNLKILDNYLPGRLNELSLALLSLPGGLATRIARILLHLAYRPSMRRIWRKASRGGPA